MIKCTIATYYAMPDVKQLSVGLMSNDSMSDWCQTTLVSDRCQTMLMSGRSKMTLVSRRFQTTQCQTDVKRRSVGQKSNDAAVTQISHYTVSDRCHTTQSRANDVSLKQQNSPNSYTTTHSSH